MRSSTLLVFVALSLSAAPTLAKPSFSLNEKREMKKIQKQIDGNMTKVNKLCKLNIKVSFDWDSFNRSNTINYSVGSGCKNAIGQIEKLCKQDEEGAALIQANVSTLRCTYSTKDQRNHRFDGKTIVESYWVSTVPGEYFPQNKPTLEKWLGDNI